MLYCIFKQSALRLRYISKFAIKLIIFGELTGVHTPLLFQSVVLYLVGHGATTDAQQFGGLGKIAICLRQCVGYHLLFRVRIAEFQAVFCFRR